MAEQTQTGGQNLGKDKDGKYVGNSRQVPWRWIGGLIAVAAISIVGTLFFSDNFSLESFVGPEKTAKEKLEAEAREFFQEFPLTSLEVTDKGGNQVHLRYAEKSVENAPAYTQDDLKVSVDILSRGLQLNPENVFGPATPSLGEPVSPSPGGLTPPVLSSPSTAPTSSAPGVTEPAIQRYQRAEAAPTTTKVVPSRERIVPYRNEFGQQCYGANGQKLYYFE